MIQELVTLSTLGIVRLLGALVLLSLGIALTLWRLKRRRNRAVVMALFLCLVALVPAALAIEIPPAGSVAQIQTTGSNAGLGIGDWWTQRDTAGSDKYHFFDISVPCTVPPGEIINVWLFDPESLNITGFPIPDLDEPQGVEDNTTFTLTDPSGGVIATTSYPPDASTDQQWVFFAAFTRGVAGCGRYRLTVTTSDDDENAWKLRVMPDDPDGDRGSGDEISLASMQTSFQHNGFGCQTFHFFVPDGTSSILLSNFDMDVPGICAVDLCTVLYTDPGGVVTTGTASDSTVWNNTTISLTHPPPGGDEISEPEAGWWRATFCLNNWNQYLFDPGVPFFHVKPLSPDMRVSKDDGTATFNPDGVLNYTITYANAGPGAALDAVLTDRLPISTTFVSCTPRPGESCGEIPPPGSGIVTFSLGTIAAGESGSVMLSVRVDPGVLTGP
ncbi:MAG: DUF11 domain-containing protein, partial [Anaerolineae bacterium]|nr:DUF11 domain-containing protein [Anaerolineae bacterium]